MDWNQLFHKKEDWQKNTFDRIKASLISAKDNRFLRFESVTESHLVMVYGKTQVGKTSLILEMIGLRDDCIQSVYDVLRAGTPRGNSSTSTAILYASSDCEAYGLAFADASANSPRQISYYDSEGIVTELIRIRQDVEQHRADPSKILYIYIPCNYFAQNYAKNSVAILDMPGIEGRNTKEALHIQNLMAMYLPVSSVCIIVCRSNDIQSLDALALPNGLDWKQLNHRFLLAVTSAYNDGTTKQFFRTQPSQRSSSFYEYVTAAYTQELRKVLGNANTTAVYPLDVGDTLRCLRESLPSAADQQELLETKARVLRDLQNAILRCKGERLQSALADLATIAENYGKEELQEIERERGVLQDQLQGKKRQITATTQYVKDLQADAAFCNERQSALERAKKKLLHLIEFCSVKLEDAAIEAWVKSDIWDRRYLDDPDKKLLSAQLEVVEQYAESMLQLLKKVEVDIPFMQSALAEKVYSDVAASPEYNALYPEKGGLFRRKKRVYIEDVVKILEKMQNNIILLLHPYEAQCAEKLNQAIWTEQKRILQTHRQISTQQHAMQEWHKNIGELEQQIDSLYQAKMDIQRRQQLDRETLDLYASHARQAYLEQREEVVGQINSSLDAHDKLLLILFLGLLDQDYQKVTGGTYETGDQ